MSKPRQTNIELLRIIAILFIISFHYVYKSGYVLTSLNVNSVIIKSFYFLGELGVNIFALITGYFMINGKFKSKKLLKLLIEVNFYYLLTIFLKQAYTHNIGNWFCSLLKSPKSTFLMFFPVIFNKYWFITAYILIYILSPYLNKFIKSLTKDELKKLLLILFFIWSVIPTFFGFFENTTESLLYYNRFLWLIFMYFLGSYIKLYSLKIFKNKKISIFTAIFSLAFMVLGIIVIFKFGNLFKKIGTKETAYFWQPNTIPMLILSVSLFELFLKLKIPNLKLINVAASTTLGVYMLHDGPLASTLWQNIFKTLDCLNSKYYLFYIIAHTFTIFILGGGVDIIRQGLERITLSKFLDSQVYEKLTSKIKKFWQKIYKVI